MPNAQKLQEANEKLTEAIHWDDKVQDSTKGESFKRMATKKVDKVLDQAVDLEVEAFAS